MCRMERCLPRDIQLKDPATKVFGQRFLAQPRGSGRRIHYGLDVPEGDADIAVGAAKTSKLRLK